MGIVESRIELKCTECGEVFSASEAIFRCRSCGEPLELKKTVSGRINTQSGPGGTLMERYREFFPFSIKGNTTSLGEGLTPLVRSEDLARTVGIKDIWLKNESANPTWSFKDRGTLAGVIHAMELGYTRIGTVSTGNMAASVAAYGARAGLETIILVGSSMPREKLGPIAIYGARLIKVEGDYGRLYYESLRIGREQGIYFINSDSPMRVAGSRTIAYEICEQLNFKIPDWIVVPVSAGGNFRGIVRGFSEFLACGLIDKMPHFIVAQAQGCCPIVQAFENGNTKIRRFESPHTMAHAIENPFPPSGNEVLRLVRSNGWSCCSVNEEEILEAQGELASQGVFVQPASAVALGAIKKCKAIGLVEPRHSAALVLTGGGLKYTAVFGQHDLGWEDCKLENLGERLSR